MVPNLMRTLAVAGLIAGGAFAQDFHFISNRGNSSPLDYDIYRYRGGNVTPVHIGPGTVEEHPILAPDGKSLFFTSTQPAPDLVGHATTFLFNQDDKGNVLPLMPEVHHPFFHPDGRSLYVTVNNEELVRFNLQTRQPMASLSCSGCEIGHSPVAPGEFGLSVYYSSDVDGDFELYAVNDALRNPRKLTNNNAYDAGAAPSPNGGLIAFCSDRRLGACVGDLWVMNRNGSGQRLVTRSTSGYLWPFGWNGNDEILYVSSESGRSGIYGIKPNGTGKRALVVDAASDNMHLLPDAVCGAGPVELELDAKPARGAPPLKVDFTVQVPSSPKLSRFEWNFGDGGKATTTTPKASHTYTSPGAFHCTVIGIDVCKNRYPADTVVQVTPGKVPYQIGLGGFATPPLDLSAIIRNPNLFCATFVGDRYFVCGAGLLPNAFHQLYVVDPQGAKVVGQHNQPNRVSTPTPRGIQDLCWDGNRFVCGVDEQYRVFYWDLWTNQWDRSRDLQLLVPPRTPSPRGIACLPNPLGQPLFLVADGQPGIKVFDNGRPQRPIPTPPSFNPAGIAFDPFSNTLWMGGTVRQSRQFIALDIADPFRPRILWEFIGGPQLQGQPGGLDFTLIQGQPLLHGVIQGQQDLVVPFVADFSFGTSCPGSSGQVPHLGFEGGPFAVGNNATRINLFGAPGANLAIPFLGGSNTNWLFLPLPFEFGAGCRLNVAPDLFLPPFPIGITGQGQMPFPIPPDPGVRGLDLMLQALVLDPRAPGLMTSSDGAKLQIR